MSQTAQLLTLVEAAKTLRLSPHTVRSFVKKGKLQPVRICRRLLFHPDELSRLVAASTCNQPPATEKGMQVQ
jgi:excisionase family DNA binding protein